MRLLIPSALAALAADVSQVASTNINSKSFSIPAYSITSGARNNPHHANWILGGVSSFQPNGLVLNVDQTLSRGSAWHHTPVDADNFEIQMEIDVRGPPTARNADGIALWFVDEADVSTFLKQPTSEIWSFFGYKPAFRGFGLLISTSDRSNTPNPSVSAAINDGEKSWDSYKDVPSSDGIYFNYRNGASPLFLSVSFSPTLVKGTLKWGHETEMKSAFIIKRNDEMPRSGYIGLTATNNRLGKNENALSPDTLFGDKVVINSFSILSPNATWASNSNLPGQDILSEIIANDQLDTNQQIRMLSESLMRHVLPRQEHLLKEMGRIQHTNRMLMDRVDVLHAYLTRGASDEKMQEALEGLKSFVFKSSRDNAEKLDELHGKLEVQNMEELKQQSAELQSTLLASTRRTLYLTLGLGSMVVLSGLLIFKRMRDMEKKHIL